MLPHGILETAVYVRDLEAARAFYTGVLGLAVYAEQPGRHLFFRCGRGMLLVFHPDVTANEATTINGSRIPPHGAVGATHLAFTVHEAELDGWRERLTIAGVAIESEVSWPNGGRSIYFRDPAGNSLELATPRLWGLDEVGPDR